MAPGAGTPTGSVSIGDGVDSCNATLSSGSGSCNLALTTVGARTLTATYAGDTNFIGSSDTEAHAVNQAATTTIITADAPDPSPINTAISVNWTTTVTAPGAGTPTGNVTVTASGGTETCTAPVASGNCSVQLTALGARTLTATYAGDAQFQSSFDTEAHTVERGASTTTITADAPDPSVSTESVLVDVMVTSVSGTLTGSVLIDDGLGTDCTASLTGGSGSCSLVPAGTGLLTFTATYTGDANVNSSMDTESHAVNSADTTLDFFLLTMGNLLPNTPVDFGFDLMVDTRGGPAPTGNVTVTVEDGPSCTATLAESSCMVEFLQPGDFVVRAEYEGDDNFEPAFSEALIVGVTSVTAIPMPHTAWILGLLLIGLTMAKMRRG